MATEKDFGLERGKEPTLEQLRLVVREPSEDVIRTFGDVFQEAGPTESTPATMGKFVAHRSILLIAPYPRLLLHRDIARTRPDIFNFRDALIRAAEEGEAGAPYPLFDDAGWFAIKREEEKVSGVTIFGESQDYGRADKAGREHTVELFIAALNGIPVENDEV
jgi:hypothetical protein